MLQMQLEVYKISFIVWNIFKNMLKMKVYKIKENWRIKMEAGGDPA